MEQSSYQKDYNSSALQEISHLSRNTKACYSVHKRPPMDPILSQKNPVHVLTSYLKAHFNIILQCVPRSTKHSVSFWVSN